MENKITRTWTVGIDFDAPSRDGAKLLASIRACNGTALQFAQIWAVAQTTRELSSFVGSGVVLDCTSVVAMVDRIGVNIDLTFEASATDESSLPASDVFLQMFDSLPVSRMCVACQG